MVVRPSRLRRFRPPRRADTGVPQTRRAGRWFTARRPAADPPLRKAGTDNCTLAVGRPECARSLQVTVVSGEHVAAPLPKPSRAVSSPAAPSKPMLRPARWLDCASDLFWPQRRRTRRWICGRPPVRARRSALFGCPASWSVAQAARGLGPRSRRSPRCSNDPARAALFAPPAVGLVHGRPGSRSTTKEES